MAKLRPEEQGGVSWGSRRSRELVPTEAWKKSCEAGVQYMWGLFYSVLKVLKSCAV